MSKRIICALVLCLLLFSGSEQVLANSTYSISKESSSQAIISSSNYGSNMRILVEKDNNRYVYSLNNHNEVLPLQLGLGSYSIKILENKNGNTYRVVHKDNISLKQDKGNTVFLSSAQPVYWKGKKAEILARELTINKETNFEKTQAIYDYIVNNISYDFDKINNIEKNYVPDIDETLENKSGICYNYSALMAGMLRSVGVPTKLVKGYKNDLKSFHAWNEVLINNKWVSIDTTYDAAYVEVNRTINMIKNDIEYKKTNEY